MTKEKNWKRITIYLLPEEHMATRLNALKSGVSATEYIRTILVRNLTNIPKDQPKEVE